MAWDTSWFIRNNVIRTSLQRTKVGVIEGKCAWVGPTVSVILTGTLIELVAVSSL